MTSLVELSKIVKRFNKGEVSERLVFDHFDFSIHKGEFISVVGSNGSGKTTLLNLICGSIPVDGGTITLGGKEITHQSEHKRAALIGRVFQDPTKGTCPSMTILENMMLADRKGKGFGLTRGVTAGQKEFFCEQLSLLHIGLEDRLSLPVGALSGGQRQALSLLLSTMTPIDLLVLDEHTAALDPKSADNVMELTDRIIKEKSVTAIMVTHNLRFAVDYGTRLVMMDRGNTVIDSFEKNKQDYTVDSLLTIFNEISIECGN
ncbi:MAG: ATP-binding cassette domain-containing protein [Eubacteriales bacterium]